MRQAAVDRARGFTLVELMVTIAMIGVLAAVAIYGIRRWIDWARAGKDKDLVQMVSYGEYAYYEDTGGYLNCSDSWTAYYPMAPNGSKHLFHDSAHSDYGCWHILAPDAEAPTYAGFIVRAGTNVEVAVQPPTLQTFNWPAPPYDKPWFVALAALDTNEDGVIGYIVTSSFMGTDVHVENEGE